MKIFKKCTLFAFLFPFVSLFANFAYQGTSTGLSVIDTTTNTIVATIPLVVAPAIVAISPDNLHVYTTGGDTVAVIDTRTNQLETTIALLPGSNPVGIAITPDSKFAYTADIGDGTVSVISLETNQLVGTIPGFVQPWGIAITPNGQFAYVVNLNSGVTPGFVSVIDLSSNTIVVPTIPTDLGPTAVAITADGKFAYVTNENSNTVTVISTATNTAITVPVGLNPFQVTTSPDSKFAYIANNAYTDPSQSSVSVISTATNTVVETIPLDSSGPAGLAVTPDNQTLYVASTVNTFVISTTTFQIIGLIPGQASSIAMTGTLVANLKGRQKINDFGVLYEYFNHLKWKSVPFSNVIGYNVYRDGVKIASVNSKTLKYDDHDQKKNVSVTYSVAPILASGQESTPLSVVVK